MKQERIYIVMATNTNGVDRAFIYKNVKAANEAVRELLESGWTDACAMPVDKIMMGELKIS